MKLGKRQLVLASLVLALGAAVYLNWQFAGDNKFVIEAESETSSELGAAQLVNNSYIETVTDNFESEAELSVDAKFSQARLTRQTSRDEAVGLLETILENVDADVEIKAEAVTQASAIAQNILKETNVEGLIKAKGFSECVAYINNGECNVIISGEITENDSLIIQEIVVEQTGLTADKIKIIGLK